MKQSIFFTVTLILLMFLFDLAQSQAVAEGQNIPNQQLVINDGEVEGETTLKFDQGSTIAIDILSDKDMELHVHGYDIKLHLKAGVAAQLNFEAGVAGRFSVTRHDAHGNDGHSALFYIEIYPQ